MTKVLSTICFLILSLNVWAQSSASTESVDVYFNAAYIQQNAVVNLRPGENILKIYNVSDAKNLEAFSLTAQDGFSYSSAEFKTDFAQKIEPSADYLNTKEKKRSAERKLALLRESKRFFEAEQNLILSQKELLGANSKLILEDVLEMGDVYRDRLPFVAQQILLLEDSVERYEKESQRWRKALEQMPTPKDYDKYLEIRVNAIKAGSYTIAFGYLSREIRWIPKYAIYNQSGNNNLSVELKATVFQKSGMDIDNARFNFISGDFINQQYLGNLPTQYVDYRSTNNQQIRGARMEMSANEMKTEEESYVSDKVAFLDTQSEGLRLFKSDTKRSIPNGQTQFSINLTKTEVPSKKFYLARPALSIYGYLQAEIEEYKRYFPVNADAELWLDETLNGNTYINSSQSDNELLINLGQDKQVICSRESILEKSKDAGLLSGNKKEKTYRININSGKPFPINVRLEDHYPISKNEGIAVELSGTNGAENLSEKGLLRWVFELDGNGSKEIKWAYTIKFEKGKEIDLR